MNKKLITAILAFTLTFSVLFSSCKLYHTHNLRYVAGVDETCIEDGNSGYYVCDDCGKLFSDEEAKDEIVITDTIIKAKGHSLRFVAGVSETCETSGNTAYYDCDGCEKYFSDIGAKNEITIEETVIQPRGHKYAYTALGNKRHVATCLNCKESHEEDCTEETLDENTKTHFYKSECACGQNSVFEKLPRIYLNTNDGKAITGTMNNKPKFACTVSVECDEQSQFNLDAIDAEVSVRGNYTATYPKKPYRIKFNKKQVMLGMDEGKKSKKWVLLADFKDPSKMRNSTAFFLGNAILSSDGYYVSDYRHVEVFENGVSKGLYLLCDQQETGSKRVNITEPEDNYADTDIGYLVEMDGYAESEVPLEQFKVDYGEPKMKFLDGSDAVDRDVNVITPGKFFENRYSVKSDIYSQEQNDFIKKTIENVFKVTYDAVYGDHNDLRANPYKTIDTSGNIVFDNTIATSREAVERVIDLQSLVDTYILNEICMDMDVGWSSFRMSYDAGEKGKRKLTFEAPWDWDSALGYSVWNTKILLCANAYKGGGTPGNKQNIWLLVLVGQDWFWQEVYAKWSQVKEAGAFDEAIRRMDLHIATYKTYRDADNELWVNAGGDSRGTNDSSVETLKNWLNERITWLNGEFERLGKNK